MSARLGLFGIGHQRFYCAMQKAALCRRVLALLGRKLRKDGPAFGRHSVSGNPTAFFPSLRAMTRIAPETNHSREQQRWRNERRAKDQGAAGTS
ncbi:MAG: hypothetical protein U0989_20525, partial [Azonexus sp.]|nr:hypothetical protein [Azonexus sp.]